MTEHQLQVLVADYLAQALSPPVIWTSLDAGAGKMSKASAGLRKARGVKRGWPDVLIMWPNGDQPCVLGIELKAAKGNMSAEQRDMFCAFTRALCTYVVCRSLEDVAKSLEGFEVPHRKVNIWPKAKAA